MSGRFSFPRERCARRDHRGASQPAVGLQSELPRVISGMANIFSVSAHWQGGFDEAGLQRWAEDLFRRLAAPKVSLGLVFLAPRFTQHAAAVLEVLRVHARIPLLVGCSGASLVAGTEEIEEQPGI